MQNIRLQKQLVAAIFAAVIAVFAQFTIPLPIVPLTLQTFIVGLTATILGRKVGSLAVIIYLVLGAIGLPVYAGGSAGVGVLFGPSGGYLWGFVLCAFLIGTIIQINPKSFVTVLVANVLGFATTLIVGSIWLKFATGMPLNQAFIAGCVNFLLPDMIKAVCSAGIGFLVCQRLPQRFLKLVQN